MHDKDDKDPEDPQVTSRWLPQGMIERMGAALVAPGRALVAADGPAAAGKTGSDVAVLMALFFVATHAREIVIGAWVIGLESVRAGLGAILGALGRAISMDLGVLFVAALVLTLAAGKRRALGRDFDLACVAFVPYLVVKLAATLLVRVPGVAVSAWLERGVAVVAYGWAAYVLLLAWRQARSRRASSMEHEPAQPAPGEGS